MNSIVGSLHWSQPGTVSRHTVLGSDAQLRSLGHATIEVVGDSASVSSGNHLLCAVAGRIDNVTELIGSIEAPHGSSPAAVVSSLIAASGPNAIQLLRGEFAGIFTNGDELWAFRDHMGFWPMFYTIHEGGVVAADSIGPCVSLAGRPYEVDRSYLENCFYGKIRSSTATSIVGIERIPAGSIAHLGMGKSTTERYWVPEGLVEVDPPHPADVPEEFDALMIQAVDRMMSGDDGIALSGGIDSPVLAAFAAPRFRSRFGKELLAVTAVYPDLPAVDELEFTSQVAEYIGIPLHTYASKASATDDLAKWVSLLEGPVPVVSLAETFEALSFAQSLGINNLLTGEWAEFLYDMPQRTLAYLITQRRWQPARSYWQEIRDQGVAVSTIVSRLAKDFAPFSMRKGIATSKMGANTPGWIDKDRLVFLPRGPVAEEWRSNQSAMTKGPGLGLEADHVVQAAAGVAIRRPFADVDLVEFFLRLPAEVKYPGPGRKRPVKSMMRGRVPDAILDRTQKTLFDDAVMAGMDYDSLSEFLADDEIIDGVDYRQLRSRISRRELDLFEYMWAKDLAAVHAFVAYAATR